MLEFLCVTGLPRGAKTFCKLTLNLQNTSRAKGPKLLLACLKRKAVDLKADTYKACVKHEGCNAVMVRGRGE